MSWWRRHPQRLRDERELMAEKFPQFSLERAQLDLNIHGWTIASKGQLYWRGSLMTVSGKSYSVALTYPPVYPGQEIRAYVIKPYQPNLSLGQHRYGDGHLCLYSNDHGGRGQGTGPGMTAVTYVSWTSAWLHAMEIFLNTGRWPENNFFDRSAFS